MARIFLDSSLKGKEQKDLPPALETIFNQLEDQVNGGCDLIGLSDDDQKLPQGIRTRDVVVNLRNGELRVGLYNGVEVVYASFGSFTGAITDTQHGTRGGGNLHDLATTTIAGFMSAGDKSKLDHYKGDTSRAGVANLTLYPDDGDWGFHTDTAAVTYSIAKNKSGTIFTTLLT